METSQLPVIVHWEIIAVYPEIRTEHTNTLCGQNVGFFKLNWMLHKGTARL
jgi:hypothetical protein